ncbi:MAG: hypothetical protein KKA79_10695 [Nanoarchaeota archaeon]|nr:hypothetical protein [Nanoarchaeota archaeon]
MKNKNIQKEKKLSQIVQEREREREREIPASEYANLPRISLNKFYIPEMQQKPISQAYASSNKVLVLDSDKEEVKIAIAEPNLILMDELKKVFPKKIEFYLADPQEIESELERIYNLQEYNGKQITIPDSSEEENPSKYPENKQTGKAVQMVDYILKTAIEGGASDIHIEAKKPVGKVKIRVDGVLKQIPMPKEFKEEYSSVISRIKILTRSMKIEEKVIPQDGSFSIEYHQKKGLKPIDFRVSTINSSYGESLVLRVLDQEKAQVSLLT